jgi:hypothetical protein
VHAPRGDRAVDPALGLVSPMHAASARMATLARE